MPCSRAHPTPAAPTLTFCPDKPWKRKSKEVPQREAAGPADPRVLGAKDLPASRGAQGAPVGQGGQRHPAEGHGDVTHGPDGASLSPESLLPAPSQVACVFCTEGERIHPEHKHLPRPHPPHRYLQSLGSRPPRDALGSLLALGDVEGCNMGGDMGV